MYRDISSFVSSCEICIKTKSNQTKPQGYIGTRPPTQPWTIISMDTIGPYTKSASGHQYALVIEDIYTRYLEIFPLRQQTGREIAKHLRNVLCHWGPVRQIISDNGKEFINKDLQTLFQQYNIQFTPTPIGHPCANLVERCNRTIKPMIVAFTSQN